MDITYTARVCLDINRIVLTLLESDDLAEFFSSYWDIKPIDTGSEITYSIRSIPNSPLPYSSYVNKRRQEWKHFSSVFYHI